MRRRRVGGMAMLAALMTLCGGSEWSAAAQNPGGAEIATWFPIRQGDSWTYDWSYRIGPKGAAPAQTIKRTRAFEGREFVDTGMTDKLASENGDYALFTVSEKGLLLHGAAEMQRDARFIFDPPITLLTTEMKPGEWLSSEQLAEDGKTVRRFASRYEMVPSVETPMGRFENCLRLVWTMDEPGQRHETTYYLVREIGIVAYGLEVSIEKPRRFEMSVEARLTLAQLQGRTFRKASEIPVFLASRKASPENARARTMLRKAHESQYVWDKKFPGLSASFRYRRDGGDEVSGRLTVDRDFGIEVECTDSTARAAVHAEISQLVSYRQPRPFAEVYDQQSRIGFGEVNDLATEVVVSDETGTAAGFLLADREIVRVSRSYGRVRFVNQMRSIRADDGRFIANEADIQYFSNETGETVGQTSYRDAYRKIGGWWLPVVREKTETSKGRSQSIRMSIDWQ